MHYGCEIRIGFEPVEVAIGLSVVRESEAVLQGKDRHTESICDSYLSFRIIYKVYRDPAHQYSFVAYSSFCLGRFLALGIVVQMEKSVTLFLDIGAETIRFVRQ